MENMTMAFKPSFDPEKGLIKAMVRLSYCNILRKTASVKNGSLKYRTNGLIYKNTPEGKATKAVLDKAVAKLVEDKWPGKNPEKFLASFDSKRVPIFDGDKNLNDDGDVKEHFEDTWYVKLTNDKKPKLKARNGQDAEEEEKDEMFVSGYWAIAYFHLYAVKDEDKGGKGIFITLDALQYFKKDEQFSGGGIDDDEIEDYGDEDDGDDAPASSKSKKSSSINDDEI
jgi:Protein of unknown function (DUF2815)